MLLSVSNELLGHADRDVSPLSVCRPWEKLNWFELVALHTVNVLCCACS